jgi:glycine cleavage system H lipoate-binding protein
MVFIAPMTELTERQRQAEGGRQQVAEPARVRLGKEPPGERVRLGDTIGWFEGFKARSDLFSVADGAFLGSNPLLVDRIAVVDDDRYRRGWLYEVRGTAEPAAMDMHAYAALLDDTIDRMRESQREPTE